MKTGFLITFCLCFSCCIKGQENISIDTHLGNWSGDKHKFLVNEGKLQLNDIAAGKSQLFTPSTLVYAEWEFQLQLKFAPSATNALVIYLTADTNNTSLIKNSYYLRLGENGSSDAFELIKRVNGINQVLIRGREVYGNELSRISVKVIHQPDGTWRLFTDATGEQDYFLDGIASDNAITTSKYLGLECLYTVTRASSFYFNQLSIKTYTPDIIGPKINKYTINYDNSIILFFDEIIIYDSLYVFNLNLNNQLSDSISLIPPSSIQAFFQQIIPNTYSTLSLSSVYDLWGNKSDTTLQFYYEKDLLPPLLISAKALDQQRVQIEFNEAIRMDSVQTHLFRLGDRICEFFQVISNTTLLLHFDKIPTNTTIPISVDYIYDMAGNKSNPLQTTILLAAPKAREIAISEILYDPATGIQGEFIEIINLSDTPISSSDLKIAKGFIDNLGNVVPETIYELALPTQTMAPMTYLVLTELKYWSTTPIHAFDTRIPTLNNDGTTVILLNQFDEVLDAVTYDKTMHHPSISNTKGVSLEKIDLGIYDQKNNWTSASTLEGSTPGYVNSANHQFQFSHTLSIEPKVLDFHFGEALFKFSYQFDDTRMGNCSIFNEGGQKILDLLVNEHLASQGIFTWSPSDRFNISTGNYIVLWETWNNLGDLKSEIYVVSIIR